jgi:hypothetical protein
VRQELGVTALGGNGVVLPPGAEWFARYRGVADKIRPLQFQPADVQAQGWGRFPAGHQAGR